MSTTHGKTVVTADDGVSEVGSDEWNAKHNTLVPDTGTWEEVDRVVYATTERFIAQGSGRMLLRETVPPFRGTFSLGSMEVLNDNYQLQYRRTTLPPGARATLVGNAELFIFDLAPVGRLVLAGRGG